MSARGPRRMPTTIRDVGETLCEPVGVVNHFSSANRTPAGRADRGRPVRLTRWRSDRRQGSKLAAEQLCVDDGLSFGAGQIPIALVEIFTSVLQPIDPRADVGIGLSRAGWPCGAVDAISLRPSNTSCLNRRRSTSSQSCTTPVAEPLGEQVIGDNHRRAALVHRAPATTVDGCGTNRAACFSLALDGCSRAVLAATRSTPKSPVVFVVVTS